LGAKKILLKPHISVCFCRKTDEQEVIIQMHQTVPKTKSHAGTSPYGDFHPYDSGVRDCRRPKGARLMNPDNSDNFDDDESEDSEFENCGDKGKDFEAERDRFMDWIYNNEELKAHRASRFRNYPRGVVEEAELKFYLDLFRQYGKGKNQFLKMWRKIEKQHDATRKKHEKSLTIFLKTAFINKCKDVMKNMRLFKEPGEEQFEDRDQKWTSQEILTDDFSPHDLIKVVNGSFDELEKSELWQRVRNCVKKNCRAKYLATFIQIINLWEVGDRKSVV
jgi:hypothetical protein